jgi:hypothetical protein
LEGISSVRLEDTVNLDGRVVFAFRPPNVIISNDAGIDAAKATMQRQATKQLINNMYISEKRCSNNQI